ncbi:unnamed protein product [Gordionus sp. m RMFG-2023]|uniref:dehydrogenase/reductase SDR family member on chromosome X homolog n=1 Tax=Gordionus sp. m RMFG-2023 TaxID=3053472 RepID=UPI0030DF34B9
MDVIIASNQRIEGEYAIKKIINGNDDKFKKGRISYHYLNLLDPVSIVTFSNVLKLKYKKIDVLINNAGIMSPKSKNYSEDGYGKICLLLSLVNNDYKLFQKMDIKNQIIINDKHFIINFLGPTLLTYLLLPLLQNNDGKYAENYDARIINLSSVLHYIGILDIDNLDGKHYSSGHAFYARSKLALTAWTISLANILSPSRKGSPFDKFLPKILDKSHHGNRVVNVNCCHPGIIYTPGLYQHFASPVLMLVKLLNWLDLLRKPIQGAQTILYLALAPELGNSTGLYFDNCRPILPSSLSRSPAIQEAVMELSQAYVAPYL